MKRHDTEKEFITAFWKLYEEKSIEKISIGRLCQLAGYNRATFYNHFENIYDLFDKAVMGIYIPVRDEIFTKQNFYDFLRGNMIEKTFLTHFARKDQYIELLFKRRDYYILGEKLKQEFLLLITEALGDDGENLRSIKIMIEYQISAVLGVIDYWYQSGKVIPEQEILQTIYSISSQGVFPFLGDIFQKTKQ